MGLLFPARRLRHVHLLIMNGGRARGNPLVKCLGTYATGACLP